MNSVLNQKILLENVRPSVCELKTNYPKHTIKTTLKWLKSNTFEVLEWPSQSPDVIPIEMSWQDLKRAVPV
jgi:hypothetical protein